MFSNELFDQKHKQLRGKFGLSKGDNEAVVFVNYYEAKSFCEWLTKKEGKTYRLPTEAEWEYACRAGSSIDTIDSKYGKNQMIMGKIDTTVNTTVKMMPCNDYGLYDMHGNVEEWCLDWYGSYSSQEQIDPVGRIDGDFRVTRGGSHSTPIRYLRSANRLAMVLEDKHWLTGFRVVQAEYPTTKPLPIDAKPTFMKTVSQVTHTWSKPKTEAFFEEPIVYIKRHESPYNLPLYKHSHCPAITWCENGDLLAVWFYTNKETGREMMIVESRLRAGNTDWDEFSIFFKVPDRDMTGSTLFNDGKGNIIHLNGVSIADHHKYQAMTIRTSSDNGATWSKPRMITEHAPRNLVIGGMIQTKEGWLAQIADGEELGAFHISKDGGKTWNDEGKGIPNNFVEGGTGGSIAGIHAGVVQLSNGNFIAFGRGSNIVNKEGRPCMPMSISTDHGKTWKYSASEFTPVTGGQRLVLKRLNEGAILLVSFTHTSPTPNVPFDSTKYEKMIFKNKQGAEFRGYGMFAALSFDEGKTWTMKKLVTDGKERHLDGGGNTGLFQMDKTHAEPRGYLAITQTPDNTIHLISSNIHYRFNLKWLMQAND